MVGDDDEQDVGGTAEHRADGENGHQEPEVGVRAQRAEPTHRVADDVSGVDRLLRRHQPALDVEAGDGHSGDRHRRTDHGKGIGRLATGLDEHAGESRPHERRPGSIDGRPPNASWLVAPNFFGRSGAIRDTGSSREPVASDRMCQLRHVRCVSARTDPALT